MSWLVKLISPLEGNRDLRSDIRSASDKFNLEVLKGITGAQLPRVNFDHISKIKIPSPTNDIQKEIVQKIEEERKVIEGNKKLVEIYTQKIQDRINKVWGDD